MKDVVQMLAGIAALFVTLPIWFYLLYKVLWMLGASELMWFLYWIYIPATILVHAGAKLAVSGK
jgi:hypothetical protein